MKVHIKTLRNREFVRRLLLKQGWRLDRSTGPDYAARHPGAKDEEAARDLLNDLGLLTSSAVHIEFDPHAN
jgi:hypothetical protein